MSAPDPLLEILHRLESTRHARAVGLHSGARGWVLARLQAKLGVPLLCVTADEDSAEALAADLAFFLGGPGTPSRPTVLQLPAEDSMPWDELIPDTGIVTERLGALFHLQQGAAVKALVVPAFALAKRMIPPKVMQALSHLVRPEEEVSRDALALKLAEMGYRNVPLVEDVGTFSVRGDILDVFPPLADKPLRLEFFGDFIESMRPFEPETQRTPAEAPKVTELRLLPARELFFSADTRRAAEQNLRALAEHSDVPTSRVRERIDQIREGINGAGLEGLLPGFFDGGLAGLFEYLPAWTRREPLVFVDNPSAVTQALEDHWGEAERSHRDAIAAGELTFPPEAHFLRPGEVLAALAKLPVLEAGALTLTAAPEAEPPVAFAFGETKDLREAITTHHGEEGALTPLLTRLQQWRDEGLLAAVACGTAGQADRLKRLLAERETPVQVHAEPLPGNPAALFLPGVLAHVFLGEISKGFVDKDGQLAVLSDEEIFGTRARRTVKRRKGDSGFSAAAFRDLKEGDLVVHAEFGVARYGGLTQMELQGIPNDFLLLEYFGKDKIYLPVGRMRLISRFTGGDPDKVVLDKLGSDAWVKTKARVREQLLKMAAELLNLYAARRAHPGHRFHEPDRYFRQFEADFAFDETPDQQRAIDEVLADMLKPEVMDRLVCGDVGYGKTEVAMRATFKAVLDKKQVAILVPTTLLAHQHFQSFRKRFAGYPVTVEVVSSLRKPGEVRDVLRRALEGRVDVLIGTHKLLGGEVSFKDLGLLVIDEEQRFGVKQKEQLKKLKTQVDVLTLSATPIPRTLNMAMSGLRDMSLITTPPADRRAIRTFVNRFDPEQIKTAILREVQRGGQVFFVHNRVSSIHSMEKFLKELVPTVSVGVAHGQMAEGVLEKVMLEFVEKKHQVLLCTSIIESGIDISNANTMIVNRADAFGLAQLYQLRGRVGRSKERAYAYLLVPARTAVTKDAERRLEVLQAFTELGAGFSIASHDLEIRGAGNLLGGEQSGSIEAVGFDLYAQMLEEAVAEMRGEPPRTEVEPDVNLPIAAYLPDDYVPDVHQRLVLYKRLSSASTPEDLEDLRAELIDRYGDAPNELDALCELMSLKMTMRGMRLRQLDGAPGRLVITLGPDALLDGAKLARLVQKSKGALRLTPDMKLVARLGPEVRGHGFVDQARKVLRDLEALAPAE
ncbi:MAG: Transcription-repair coupling factor [Myxococcaceae bacterium]|nr:Transcription-repair coupling factor [Myxococcaceae bacterium]